MSERIPSTSRRLGRSYDHLVDIHARTAANRRLLADFFDALDEDQLQTRSLCDAWTVREVLGHLLMPLTGSLGGFLLQVVRARGSINRASEAVAGELARRPISELTALLRDRAGQHGKAPGVGRWGRWPMGACTSATARGPLASPKT
ncbi:MAG: maleylpyruvate isomerase N-terminal domain-containing protein [Nocardioidaceae bacterium]